LESSGYEIALHKPIFAVGQGLNLLSDKYQLASCVSTGQGWFGSSKLVPGSLLGTTLSAIPSGGSAGAIITFPNYIVQGTYLVHLAYCGQTGGAIPEIVWTMSGANCSFPQVFSGASGADAATAAELAVINTGTTAQTSFLTFFVTVNAPGELVAAVTLTNTAATMTASGIYGDLIITQVNGNLTT